MFQPERIPALLVLGICLAATPAIIAPASANDIENRLEATYGPSVWDELVATEGRIRKQKKEQEYRKAEMVEAIITWSISGVILLTGIGTLSFIIYMVA